MPAKENWPLTETGPFLAVLGVLLVQLRSEGRSRPRADRWPRLTTVSIAESAAPGEGVRNQDAVLADFGVTCTR